MKTDFIQLIETHTKRDAWNQMAERVGGKFFSTNPADKEKKGGVAVWALSQLFKANF